MDHRDTEFTEIKKVARANISPPGGGSAIQEGGPRMHTDEHRYGENVLEVICVDL
jgi:hypothetical protein